MKTVMINHCRNHIIDHYESWLNDGYHDYSGCNGYHALPEAMLLLRRS